jgi:DNA repair protein RadC
MAKIPKKGTGNNQEENPHAGRRKRKREQFFRSELDNIPEHEVLEFLLFYSIPRQDTNLIAHALIKRFGSLAEVINACPNELSKVEGVGFASVVLIDFMRKFSKLYLERQAETELMELFNSERLKEYCSALYIGAVEEEFRCIYLTDDLKLIAQEKICTGRIGEVEIPMRRITRAVFERNCSNLVISHNHPAGSCIPSRADIDSTNAIIDGYVKMDISLVDHIIVGRDGVMSMREKGFLMG